ncbi:T9SS type A sorting domain-containing protein [bacterium]|nr:T9SS type A sorting domain-containing protein [bacterium]
MKSVAQWVVLLFMGACFTGYSGAQTWTSYTAANSGLAANEVRAIGIDATNARWFGTVNGLCRFDGLTWTTYTVDLKLAHNTVNVIADEVTSHGPEIWVGTNGGVSVMGVEKPDAITVATPYTPENTGLASLTVYSAAVDTGHVKWFGTDKGVSTFSGQEWATHTVEDMLSNNTVLSIAAAEDGWIYLGTKGGGVSRVDGITAASPYDIAWSGIPSDTVYVAYIAMNGDQWFGTDKGVSRHQGHETKKDWTTYSTEDGLADNVVKAISQDRDGVMWFGTINGVSRFDGTSWKTYTVADGLASNKVNAIALDPDGALWFATDGGVSRFGGTISAVDTPDELPTLITITGVYPNPFNPSTTIGFTLPAQGYVTVDIRNLAGQKVRTLVAQSMNAGAHSTVWDGKDESGAVSASGVYIVSIKAGAITASQRMTLVR